MCIVILHTLCDIIDDNLQYADGDFCPGGLQLTDNNFGQDNIVLTYTFITGS